MNNIGNLGINNIAFIRERKMLDSFERKFVAFNRVLVAVIMVVMLVTLFWQVGARYLFARSYAWIDELAGFLMVWLTYLGAGLALREGRLVGFDILQDNLPAKGRFILRFLIGLVMLAFMAFLIYCGIRFCQFGLNRETIVLQISRAIPYAGIPIGSLFFVVHLLLFLRRYGTGQWDVAKIEGKGLAGLATKLMEE